MSAGLLREAAAKMRERAEAARPSPWSVDGPYWHDDDELGQWDASELVTAGDERRPVAIPDSRDINDNHDRDADMRHIASWHPAVALAVADLLDDGAVFIEFVEQNHAEAATGNEAEYFLAVARAYLGRADA